MSYCFHCINHPLPNILIRTDDNHYQILPNLLIRLNSDHYQTLSNMWIPLHNDRYIFHNPLIINETFLYTSLYEPDMFNQFLVNETCAVPAEMIELLPEKKATDDTEYCTICLENYKVQEILSVLPCDHSFHKECIKTWLEKNSSCPVCRINFNF